MNQSIVNYLTQNKDQYPKEQLIQALRNAGNSENEISEAVAYVYGGGVTQSAWGSSQQSASAQTSSKMSAYQVAASQLEPTNGKKPIHPLIILFSTLASGLLGVIAFFVNSKRMGVAKIHQQIATGLFIVMVGASRLGLFFFVYGIAFASYLTVISFKYYNQFKSKPENAEVMAKNNWLVNTVFISLSIIISITFVALFSAQLTTI